MLDWLKSAWARWRVQISVVGGVLVIATAYGTCTYEAPSEEVSAATNTAEAVQVNSTTVNENTAVNSNATNSENDTTTTVTSNSANSETDNTENATNNTENNSTNE